MCSNLNWGCGDSIVMDEMISVEWDGVRAVSCCGSTDKCGWCCCCGSLVCGTLESSGCEDDMDDGVADEAAVVDWVEFSDASPPTFVVIGSIDILGVIPVWIGMPEELPMDGDCCGWSE